MTSVLMSFCTLSLDSAQRDAFAVLSDSKWWKTVVDTNAIADLRFLSQCEAAMQLLFNLSASFHSLKYFFPLTLSSILFSCRVDSKF